VTVRTVAYGPHPDQFLELTLPAGTGPVPLGVVVHGGLWRMPYGLELARPLAADLAAAGWAAAAVEYRRVGSGGGFPATLADVAAAVDVLPDLGRTGDDAAGRLDLSAVAVVGHSAGGHLAAWLAGRHRLPDGAPGAGPRVRPAAVVLQAGVLDLHRAAAEELGDGAVTALLGGPPEQVPERYAVADPMRLLPTGADVLCVHGDGDEDVPLGHSRAYVAAAAARGERIDLRVVPGDHMGLIDPAGPSWALVRRWLGEWSAASPAGGLTLSP
jgi:acetyl esterase/lipase